MAYTTVAKIQAQLGTTLTSEQSTYFTDVLSPGVDAYINSVTETQFGSVTTVEAFVSGDGTDLLIIPTMHTITAVNVVNNDGTFELVGATDYTEYPRSQNYVYALRKYTGEWSDGFENYRVSGIYGYSTVPDDITQAATDLAVSALSANQEGYKSEKVGDWSVTYKDTGFSPTGNTIETLHRYRRLSRSI